MVAELADLIQIAGGAGAVLGASAAAWRRGASVEDIARGAALGALAGTYLAFLYWLLAKMAE